VRTLQNLQTNLETLDRQSKSGTIGLPAAGLPFPFKTAMATRGHRELPERYRKRTSDAVPPVHCPAKKPANGGDAGIGIVDSQDSWEKETLMSEAKSDVDAIFAFIELNQPVAAGTIRDSFPQWDIEGILEKLESGGLVTKETRPTQHGSLFFSSPHKKTPVG